MPDSTQLGILQAITRSPVPENPNMMALSTAGGLVQAYTFNDTNDPLTAPCYFQNPTHNRMCCLSFCTDITGDYLLALAPDDTMVYILTVTVPGLEMAVAASINYGAYTATSCAWYDDGTHLDIVIGCDDTITGTVLSAMVDRTTKNITHISETPVDAPVHALDTFGSYVVLGMGALSPDSAHVIMGTITDDGTYDYFQAISTASFATGFDEINALSFCCGCGCDTLPYVSVGGSTISPEYNGVKVYEWDYTTTRLELVNTTTNVDHYVSDVACSYDGTDMYIGVGLGTQFVANMYKVEPLQTEPIFQSQTPIVTDFTKKYITWGCCGTRGNKYLVGVIRMTQTIDVYRYTAFPTPALTLLQSHSFDNAIRDIALYYPDYFVGNPEDHIYMAVSLDTTDASPSSRVEVWHFNGSLIPATFTRLGFQDFPDYVVQNVAWWVDVDSHNIYDPDKQYLATAGYTDALHNQLTIWNINNFGAFTEISTDTIPSAYNYLTWGVDGSSGYLVLIGNPSLYSPVLDIFKVDITTKAIAGYNQQSFTYQGVTAVFSSYGKEHVGFADYATTPTIGRISYYTLKESLIDPSKIELNFNNTVETQQYIPMSLHMANNGDTDQLLVGLFNMQDQGTYTVAVYDPVDLTLTVSAQLTSAVNSVGWQCDGNNHHLVVNYGSFGGDISTPFAYSKGYIYTFDSVPTPTLNQIIPVPSNSPY